MYVNVVLERNYSKSYTFLCDVPVEKGDFVVCDTINGPVLGEVSQLNVSTTKPCNIMRWIITKVDFAEFNAKREKRERITQLKKQLDSQIKEYEEIHKYELFAEKDPTVAQLLTELKELTK